MRLQISPRRSIRGRRERRCVRKREKSTASGLSRVNARDRLALQYSWLNGKRARVGKVALFCNVPKRGAVVVSGLIFIPRPAPQAEQINLLAEQFSTSPDYQVVNHLDELLDSEKNSVWLDN